MALRAGYKGIKKYVADMLNKMNPGDTFATDAEVATKADISALGTQEGTTASRLYNPGDHFYKDGKFCTAIAIITIGTTFTLNTNYIVEDVANSLKGFNLNTIFSNLSYVPFGFGRIGLSASASPTGSELGVDYVKFGNPEGAFIIAGRPFSGVLYLTSFYQNTWSEWKSFDLSSIS